MRTFVLIVSPVMFVAVLSLHPSEASITGAKCIVTDAGSSGCQSGLAGGDPNLWCVGKKVDPDECTGKTHNKCKDDNPASGSFCAPGAATDSCKDTGNQACGHVTTGTCHIEDGACTVDVNTLRDTTTACSVKKC